MHSWKRAVDFTWPWLSFWSTAHSWLKIETMGVSLTKQTNKNKLSNYMFMYRSTKHREWLCHDKRNIIYHTLVSKISFEGFSLCTFAEQCPARPNSFSLWLFTKLHMAITSSWVHFGFFPWNQDVRGNNIIQTAAEPCIQWFIVPRFIH